MDSDDTLESNDSNDNNIQYSSLSSSIRQREDIFTQELHAMQIDSEITNIALRIYVDIGSPSLREERRNAMIVIVIYFAYQHVKKHIDIYYLMKLRGLENPEDMKLVRSMYQECFQNTTQPLSLYESTALEYLVDFQRYLGNQLVLARMHLERIEAQLPSSSCELSSRELAIGAILHNHPDLIPSLRKNSPLYKTAREPDILQQFQEFL